VSVHCRLKLMRPKFDCCSKQEPAKDEAAAPAPIDKPTPPPATQEEKESGKEAAAKDTAELAEEPSHEL